MFFCVCMCCVVGQRQCTTSKPPKVGLLPTVCCMETSKGIIRETVDKCYEQKKELRPCKVHAYM